MTEARHPHAEMRPPFNPGTTPMGCGCVDALGRAAEARGRAGEPQLEQVRGEKTAPALPGAAAGRPVREAPHSANLVVLLAVTTRRARPDISSGVASA